MLLALEIIGGAVVLETAIQLAWHLGLCRFWRPKAPRCPELFRFTDGEGLQCKHRRGHDGPHEFRYGSRRYYRSGSEVNPVASSSPVSECQAFMTHSKFSDAKCRHKENHVGPHEFVINSMTYFRENNGKDTCFKA